MIAYLDNSATTRPFHEVVQKMNEINADFYGNPSSLHSMGFEAEKIIKHAKQEALSALGAKEGQFVFTSGGTEANNLAILGAVYPKLKRKPLIITTKTEHPSVLEPFSFLEEQGADCVFLAVDQNGVLDFDELKHHLSRSPLLVSVMMVNNETGSLQPIDQIARLIKSVDKNIIFHVDGVQAFGKLPIHADRSKIDLLSVSGHKINGPKGVGGLYVRKGIALKPIVFGGHQENNLRSGTQNTPAIGGFSVAVQKAMKDLEENQKHMTHLKNLCAMELAKLPYCHFNSGLGEDFAPHILNVSFEKVKSEVLLHALERHGVFVSTGSACSSNRPALSGVLLAMGVDRALVDCALRISFCRQTTQDEVVYAMAKIKEEAEILRKILS